MNMKRQINMCVSMSMISILIEIKFDIDTNNDKLLIILYINSLRPSVTEVLAGEGKGGPVEAAGDKKTVRFL